MSNQIGLCCVRKDTRSKDTENVKNWLLPSSKSYDLLCFSCISCLFPLSFQQLYDQILALGMYIDTTLYQILCSGHPNTKKEIEQSRERKNNKAWNAAQ